MVGSMVYDQAHYRESYDVFGRKDRTIQVHDQVIYDNRMAMGETNLIIDNVLSPMGVARKGVPLTIGGIGI